MRTSFILLCVAAFAACESDDETTTSTTSSSRAATTGSTASAGGSGGQSAASSGSGGECPVGSNSTVVEATAQNMCPEPGQSALNGTGAPGECCEMALDCAPTCCACAGSSNGYFGVFCQDGVCANSDDTCTATAGDGCP